MSSADNICKQLRSRSGPADILFFQESHQRESNSRSGATSSYQASEESKLFADNAIDWPQSLMSIIFSKTDNLSKITIYKLYLEVEVLGLDIREGRIFRRGFFLIVKYNYKCRYIYLVD